MGQDDRGRPTYLSKVERDEFPPPAEDKVRKIAEIFGCDTDELPRPGRPGIVRPVRNHQATPARIGSATAND
jgi:hypothetical protein